ncbi:MAG: hypothetical protein JNM22_07490 [Saprospiraceae bacterium]|nr:hypothetical protein [Saprospiraceae bacterium]
MSAGIKLLRLLVLLVFALIPTFLVFFLIDEINPPERMWWFGGWGLLMAIFSFLPKVETFYKVWIGGSPGRAPVLIGMGLASIIMIVLLCLYWLFDRLL